MVMISQHALAQEAQERRFMERLEQPPSYRNALAELRRRAAYVRELEVRGERIIRSAGQPTMKDLTNEIQSFLDECKEQLSADAVEKFGIDLIRADMLEPRSLKLHRLPSPVPGQTFTRVVFDADFYQQVLKRGRQLKLQELGRFQATLLAFATIFAVLCIAYGILKVSYLRAAKKHQDYLTSGRISMV